MSTVTDAATLRGRFLAQFDGTVQHVLDNAPDKDIDRTRPWVRFLVMPNSTTRVTFGNGRQQRYGLVCLQVLVPLESGSAGALAIVDQFADVFRGWRSPDVDLWCDTETVRNIPNADAYQVNVFIPYTSNV